MDNVASSHEATSGEHGRIERQGPVEEKRSDVLGRHAIDLGWKRTVPTIMSDREHLDYVASLGQSGGERRDFSWRTPEL
jgi:hypothetical protein